jgi:SAM-dependent methyltransferase
MNSWNENPQLVSTPLKSCRLCDSNNLREVLTLTPTPAGDHYLTSERHPERLPVFPLSLFQCASCGHVQLGAVVDPAYLYREYIYTTDSSLGLAEHFRNYARMTAEKLSLKPGALVVEIGSNDGTLLRSFQGLGMRVVGVDPAQTIAQKATASGIPTINEFFTSGVAETILAREGPADLVIANNVMANVSSPREVVSDIRRILAPHGVFVFETGYLRYLAEDCVFDNIYHEHIDYYSVAPLVPFFRMHGMELYDVHVSNSKGSSIRCYVSLKDKKIPIADIVPELIAREKTLGYGEPEPYTALAGKLQETKSQLHEILDCEHMEGRSVAGFGASVGVTTVLYHLDLGSRLDYLVDDNRARQGLLSPGLGLPVTSPDVLLSDRRPELVLILAWRYSAQIVTTHVRYQQGGGAFLQMLPEVRRILGSGELSS